MKAPPRGGKRFPELGFPANCSFFSVSALIDTAFFWANLHHGNDGLLDFGSGGCAARGGVDDETFQGRLVAQVSLARALLLKNYGVRAFF